jgi:hypothetical protein
MGFRAPLAGGDAGTEQTIDLMRKLVDQDLANSSFVRFAQGLVQNVPSHDEWSEVEAVYDWVSSNIRFVKDPLTKEVLTPPSELLKVRAGDCDDIAMTLGALYLAIGYPARLVTVAANAQAPDEFSHVYVEVEVPPGSGVWVAADAARPGAQFGVHPPMYSRRRAWSLADNSYEDLQGTRLRGLGYIRYRTLGQDDGSAPDFSDFTYSGPTSTPIPPSSGGGFNWGSVLTPVINQLPTDISIATGTPYTQRSGTSLVTTSPYGSYMTPYSPGYGIPQAGYPSVSLSATSNWIWPLLLVAGVVLLMKR